MGQIPFARARPYPGALGSKSTLCAPRLNEPVFRLALADSFVKG